MKNTSQKISRSFITAAAVLFAIPFAAQAITVDGQYNDWTLTEDLFAPMYRAGNPDQNFSGHEILSNAYLRYDSNIGTAYVLVLDTEERPDISASPSDAWIKIYELGNDTIVDGSSGNDGDSPDFSWVTNAEGGVIGWEGSFPLEPNLYSGLEIHVNHGVDTSSTGKKNVRGVDKTIIIDTATLPSDDVASVTYSITGTVFIDADMNGVNESEPGISNVTVELHDGEGNIVASVPTSESGDYEFTDLLAGDYNVIVVPENDILDDFNEILADYFIATTETHVTLLGLGEDSVENNFGFAPNPGAIIDDFNSEDPDENGAVFQGNGKTIGFWKHQNAVADRGKGRAQVDAIEELLLPDPFQFDDANEFKAAHDVMAMRTSDALELLKKQLLGTEFNDVAGRGLEAPFNELQDKLIAWGEHLAANSELFTREELIDAKDIFDLINNTGNK